MYKIDYRKTSVYLVSRKFFPPASTVLVYVLAVSIFMRRWFGDMFVVNNVFLSLPGYTLDLKVESHMLQIFFSIHFYYIIISIIGISKKINQIRFFYVEYKKNCICEITETAVWTCT